MASTPGLVRPNPTEIISRRRVTDPPQRSGGGCANIGVRVAEQQYQSGCNSRVPDGTKRADRPCAHRPFLVVLGHIKQPFDGFSRTNLAECPCRRRAHVAVARIEQTEQRRHGFLGLDVPKRLRSHGSVVRIGEPSHKNVYVLRLARCRDREPTGPIVLVIQDLPKGSLHARSVVRRLRQRCSYVKSGSFLRVV